MARNVWLLASLALALVLPAAGLSLAAHPSKTGAAARTVDKDDALLPVAVVDAAQLKVRVLVNHTGEADRYLVRVDRPDGTPAALVPVTLSGRTHAVVEVAVSAGKHHVSVSNALVMGAATVDGSTCRSGVAQAGFNTTTSGAPVPLGWTMGGAGTRCVAAGAGGMDVNVQVPHEG